MIPDEEPSGPPREFLSPGWALMLTLFGALLQGSLVLILLPALGEARPALFALSALVAYGLAFAMGAPRVPDPPGPHLGFRAPPTQAWLAVPFLACGVLIASEVDNVFREFVPRPEELESVEPPTDLMTILEWLLVVSMVLPAIQEIFFRGLVLPGLVLSLGPAAGLGFMALLDGLAAALAGGPWVMGYVATSALLLGALRIASGSLLPGLLLGATFGLFGVLAAQDAFGIPGFDDTSAAHTPLEYLAPAAFAVGVGLALCRSASRSIEPIAMEPPADRDDELF